MADATAAATFLLATILLLLLIFIADAFILHLPSSHVKCFLEELRSGVVSIARYCVVFDEDPSSGADRKISLPVTGPEPLHMADVVEFGHFSFIADEAVTYMVCLWSPRFELSTIVTVDFEWRAWIAAKEWASATKRTKIQVSN